MANHSAAVGGTQGGSSVVHPAAGQLWLEEVHSQGHRVGFCVINFEGSGFEGVSARSRGPGDLSKCISSIRANQALRIATTVALRVPGRKAPCVGKPLAPCPCFRCGWTAGMPLWKSGSGMQACAENARLRATDVSYPSFRASLRTLSFAVSQGRKQPWHAAVPPEVAHGSRGSSAWPHLAVIREGHPAVPTWDFSFLLGFPPVRECPRPLRCCRDENTWIGLETESLW